MGMISNLQSNYYYCEKSFSHCGQDFWIGWSYQKDYVDRFRNINKFNFRFVE